MGSGDRHWDDKKLPGGLDSLRTALLSASHASLLLRVADGTRLAIDVQLPAHASDEKRPAILLQCRYGRAWRLRWPLRLLTGKRPLDFAYLGFVPHWLAAGYAVVSVDVRGAGASFGRWARPWAPQEASDSLEVLDWISAQPWSSGEVVLVGQSYDATAALRTAERGHASVRAVVAINPFLDTISDAALVGGLRSTLFLNTWGRLLKAFDSQRLHTAPGGAACVGCITRGFARAAEPQDTAEAACGFLARRRLRSLRAQRLAEALAERKGNWDVIAQADGVQFSDDSRKDASGNPVSFEQLAFGGTALAALAATRVPVLWTSAWWDCTVCSAAAGFEATRKESESELLVGPWVHTMWQRFDGAAARLAEFPFTRETLRFALRHAPPPRAARPEATAASERVRLFLIRSLDTQPWQLSSGWPQTSAVPLYLAPGRLMSRRATPENQGGRDEILIRRSDAPQGFSRWQAALTIGIWMGYRHLSYLPLRYTSVPLSMPLHMLGSAVATLYIDSSDGIADLFVYLLDEDEKGGLAYVSEGCLCSRHRAESEAEALGERGAVRLPQAAPALPLRTLARREEAPPLPAAGAGGAAAVRMALALMPASYVFHMGHSVVLAVTGGDPKHFEATPLAEGHAERRMGVRWGGEFASCLSLPMLPA